MEALGGLGDPRGPLAAVVALVEARWSRAREAPTPEALERLREALAAADDQLRGGLLVARAVQAGELRWPPEEAPREPVPAEPAAASADDVPARPRPRAGTSVPSGEDGDEAPEAVEGAFPPFRDQLTGLLSREGFETRAAGELKRARRHGVGFAVLLLRPGTPGTEELRAAARAVEREIRASDLPARQVGHILAVGVGDAGAREAGLVGRRLVEALEREGVWERGALGLATHPTDGDALTVLLAAARRRLENGRAGLQPVESVSPRRPTPAPPGRPPDAAPPSAPPPPP